jgi:hypothetical protein
MRRIASCALLLLSFVACAPAPYAVVNGKLMPRSKVGYTDRNYFAVQHTNAHPEQRGPSSGLRSYGGSIVGRICGVDVNYETEYRGRYLDVLGYVAPADQINEASSDGKSSELIAFIRIRDRGSLDGGLRDFTGAVGRSANGADSVKNRSPVVDFTLGQGFLRGRIGLRYYNLRAQNNSYVGLVNIRGNLYPFELKGRGRLWSMPAADQAAILPLMMTCVDVSQPRLGKPILTVDLDATPKG